jgi:hypothetical protein
MSICDTSPETVFCLPRIKPVLPREIPGKKFQGSVRRKVLKGLLRPNTPAKLAKTHGIARSSVSRSIQSLEKVGLVECLTPDEKMDRYYRTTGTGKKVAGIIEGKGNNFSGDLIFTGAFPFCAGPAPPLHSITISPPLYKGRSNISSKKVRIAFQKSS